MKYGFDSLQKDDNLYNVDIDTGKVYTYKIDNIKIIRSEKINIADYYEEPELVDRYCYKIIIECSNRNEKENITVDLTNSDTYKFHFAGFYVYKEDAINYLIDLFNDRIKYNNSVIKSKESANKDYKEKIDALKDDLAGIL